MKTSVPASYKTALAIVLGLSADLTKTYAMGNNSNKENQSFTPSSHLHRYQLISSEGKDSYNWLLKIDATQRFKLRRSSITSLPRKIDFSKEINYIHTQGDLGSCAPQCLTLSLEYYLKKLDTEMKLSPLFAYYNERKSNQTTENDVGASLSDTIQSIYKYGVCQEATWPYSDDGVKFKVKPSSEAYQEPRGMFKDIIFTHLHLSNQIDLLKQTLVQQIPIICGINIFPSIETDKVEKSGIISMPGRFEKPIGSHAITLVGYNDKTRQIKFANSWGPKWGDKGFGYLPYDYITNNTKNQSSIYTFPNEIWSIMLTRKL